MPYITLEDPKAFGMGGLLAYRPKPARPLLELAEVLLREPNELSQGERELIVAYVSTLNGCTWSQRVHSAFATALLDGEAGLVDQVCEHPDTAPITGKLRARPPRGRHRRGDPRHRVDRRRVLHVQPLRQRARRVGAGR